MNHSNRTRTRAASLASRFGGSSSNRSATAGLPIYSLRGDIHGRVSLDSVRRGGGDGRGVASSEEEDDEEEERDDSDEYDDDDDDDQDDLEMDTLNKNSQGRGGWKLVHTSDARSPTTSRASESRPHNDDDHDDAPPPPTAKTSSRSSSSPFERFDIVEWASMSFSMLMVLLLCLVAFHICFAS